MNSDPYANKHTVQSFDDELTQLRSLITEMGGLAEAQMHKALTIIESHDHNIAKKVIMDDKKIDSLEMEIHNFVIHLIARRQPMASDLREIISAIKISTDLERIGDLAEHVAQLMDEVDLSMPRVVSSSLKHMARLALQQIKDVLDAFSHRDQAKAQQVWEGDIELDELYNSTIRELLTYMLENQKAMSFSMLLFFAAKYIERVGDHATNIAETIIYMMTNDLPADRPKGKRTGLIHPKN